MQQQFTQRSPWRLYLVLLLTISLGWGVVKPSPVQAATIAVTNTADSSAAAVGSPSGITLLAPVGLVVVGGVVPYRQRSNAKNQ